MRKDLRTGLLEELGGEEGCRSLARAFYSRVANEPILRPFFPGKSMRCAEEAFAAFLIQFLDGDDDQAQFRWVLSLRESHARFKITDTQRGAWLSQMRSALMSLLPGAESRHDWEQFFLVSSAYILGKDSPEPDHPELAERWAEQVRLDELFLDLGQGRDMQAMNAAKHFADRQSSYVGILDRMMEHGREPLVEFVVRSVAEDPQLASGRFNGRTLLHFASGYGCLPVVRQLLSMGVAPDVLDMGGHAPLYRLADRCDTAIGVQILDELVRAGANVDHGGGATRSTALHAAARRGNILAAEALLKAGASTKLRDSKGFTPLDRANNCRKTAVAELLRKHNESLPSIPR